MRIYIFVKEKINTGKEKSFSIESILPSYYNVKKEKGKKESEVLEEYKKLISREELIKIFESDRSKFGMTPILEAEHIELVTGKATKFVQGLYYAHEYGKHVEGRGRVWLYSNGYKEYEIQCLDKTLKVLDGFWEDSDNNGCGDRFLAQKSLE